MTESSHYIRLSVHKETVCYVIAQRRVNRFDAMVPSGPTKELDPTICLSRREEVGIGPALVITYLFNVNLRLQQLRLRVQKSAYRHPFKLME